MPDPTMTVQELKDQMRAFVAERDWEQFHDLKNLSMAIAVEAGELMDLFRWVDNKSAHEVIASRIGLDAVRHEVADVMLLLLSFANAAGIDVSEAVLEKLALNRQRYPVDVSRGRADPPGR
jgi:dCTP diphosphatase